MKLSRKFLNEVIDINDIDTNTLANELVLVGNEYESIYKLSNATNIIVGNVLEAYPHPNSDHLTVCKVDVGNYTLQILCGAPNVRTNIKVMVALSNAVLPSGITILKREIRGLESNGMICSLAELGIEHKYLTEEDKSGIHILPNDAKVGEDALKYLQLDDEVIDFELTANRG
ncbi:MAG: phenylalanine--tRNA ligase subunit beta, partial [Bacilli bacterium]